MGYEPPIQHAVRYCPCAECEAKRRAGKCPAYFVTAYNEIIYCSLPPGHEEMHKAVCGGCRYEWSRPNLPGGR